MDWGDQLRRCGPLRKEERRRGERGCEMVVAVGGWVCGIALLAVAVA